MSTTTQNLPESVSSSPAKTNTRFTFGDALCLALVAAALFVGLGFMQSKTPRVYNSVHLSSAQLGLR